MSQNQGVISSVKRLVFRVDPYEVEVKEIKKEKRRIKAMCMGVISPQRARNRRSKTKVKAVKSLVLKGRFKALEKKHQLANQQWFGRKLERVAGWFGFADLPIRFVAANLQLGAGLSVGQRTIRAAGMTLASKAKAIVTSLAIATLITVLF